MKIKCLGRDTASMLIFRMMVNKCPDIANQDIGDTFNIKKEDNNIVDVKVTVNGVEVDPIRMIEQCWNQLDDDFEERAKELAKKMVSLSGLEDLQDKLSRAEWQISEAIDRALENLK